MRESLLLVPALVALLATCNVPAAVPSSTRLPARSATQYDDRQLCFSVDVPTGWIYVDGSPGGFAGFGPVDKQAINISNVSFAETATLQLALANLKSGSLEPYIQLIENGEVDNQPALWITLTQGQQFQFVVLVIPPQCTANQHALFISAVDMDRPSFGSFLKRVHLH